ncbi:hypothetical protein BD310DRAFT_571076 [Dichomitus squalens]|uniref:Uncharacterized protein n=1 Tax=Dichomitus squalens TaxID=114155 RepID=A0A4V2K7R8_9APHY|nr:hypothetical protein BD310DRAFT_571076 [Dichomitus squalens]
MSSSSRPTETEVFALVAFLRDQDLSSNPILHGLLQRLERSVQRNHDATRYPTPPVEGSQGQLPEEDKTNKGPERKRPASASWRCEPQPPSEQPNGRGAPTQSVFALHMAGPQAIASIGNFTFRYAGPQTTDEQDDSCGPMTVNQTCATEETKDVLPTETSRWSKRRRTRVD